MFVDSALSLAYSCVKVPGSIGGEQEGVMNESIFYLAKRRAFCKICFLVEMFVYLYIYILFCYNFFQISTRSVDHSFSAIVLKLYM